MTDTAVSARPVVDRIEVPLVEPAPVGVPVADSIRRLVDKTGETVDIAAFRWHRRLALIARAGDIRRHSRIRLQVWAPVDEVVERVARAPDRIDAGTVSGIATGAGATLTVLESLRPLPGGGHRAAAVLRVRWSWPSLPVWVTVEPWWREHTAVSMTLRSTHRLRYPRRYWASAHRTLRELVGPPGRPPHR